MTADTAPSRTWTLGARATTGVLALVMAVTPWLLLQAHDDIRGTTEQFGQHARVVTGLANIQREVLLVTREIDSLGRGGSLERAGLRRSFLTQHVRVTRGSASPDSPATAALTETTSALGRYDANVRSYERADDEATRAHIAKATHELLADLEIAVKHGYDAEEQRLYGTMVTGLAARARAYRWIAALAAASVALVAIVIATLRRRARSDLERAHAALLVEVDERTAAEAEVRAAEERSRALVQYSSDMVAVLDNAGVVTYSSPACDRLMGAGASTSHLGTPVVQWVHADDVAQVQTALDRCRADADAPVTVSFRVTDAVGAARHLECTLTNLLDATAVRGIVMNGRT